MTLPIKRINKMSLLWHLEAVDLTGGMNNNRYQIKQNNITPLINDLEMQDIFKDKDKREGDSVIDLIGEVSQLLVTLTKISQRINAIGLEVQDKSKQVTWPNLECAGNLVHGNVTY